MTDDFWKKKKVIVSGGSGLIGSVFKDVLELRGAEVCAFSLNSGEKPLDILDFDKIRNFFQKNSADLFIHCAAIDGNAKFKAENAKEIFEKNIQMAQNIVACLKVSKIKDVILISSAELYAKTKSLDDNYTYSAMKKEIEKIFLNWSLENNNRLLIARPSNVYGDFEEQNLKKERVIPAIIRRAIENKNIEIWGLGNDLKSFIYSKDLVEEILKRYKKNDFSLFYLGAEKIIKIKDLAEMIIKLSASSSSLVYLNENFTTANYLESEELFLSQNKFLSKRDLESSLRDLIKDYKKKSYVKK